MIASLETDLQQIFHIYLNFYIINYIKMKERKIAYPLCCKGGDHNQESLNKYCIESSCITNQLCCSICIRAEHKNHRIKTFQELINSSKTNIKLIQQSNKDIVLDQVNCRKKQFVKTYNQYKKQIYTLLDSYQQGILEYFDLIVSSVKAKTHSTQKQIKEYEQSIFKIKTVKELQTLIARIIKLYPYEQQNSIPKNLITQKINQLIFDTQKQINKSIQCIKSYYKKQYNFSVSDKHETIIIQKNVQEKNAQLEFQKSASKVDNQPPIRKSQSIPQIQQPKQKKYVPNQKITIDTLSTKFDQKIADLMIIGTISPPIDQNKTITSFLFRIRQMSNIGFIAFGLCDLNKIKADKFILKAFDKGIYVMTNLGKSWPTVNTQQNDSLKPFTFQKYDVIQMQINDNDKKIRFMKKKVIRLKDQNYYWASTNQAFELDFIRKNQQQLVPLVATFNNSAEIELLKIQEYKKEQVIIQKKEVEKPNPPLQK